MYYKKFIHITNVIKLYFKILTKNKINLVNYCNFFFLLSAHPLQIEKYYILKSKSYFNYIYKFIIEMIKNLINVFSKVFERNYFYATSKKKVDVIFFSHLVNSGHLKNNIDFYFGKLPKVLKKKSITVLNNETELTNYRVIKNNKTKRELIVLSNYIGIFNEFTILKSLISQTIKIIFKKKKFEKIKGETFYKNFILNIISQNTIKNIRLHFQIKKILQLYEPKKILYTFEGHCYEKIILDTTKLYNKDIECIAYQHSIIFPIQPSLLSPLNTKFEPEKILTSGFKGKNILKKCYKKSKIFHIGNPRHKKKKINFNTKKNICLLIPDGTLDETKKMINLIPAENKKINSQIKYLVRFHPGVSDFFRKNTNPNIKFSNNKLSHDLDNCRWAVYRGTGAVVHCLAQGIRPIYYSYNKREISIDPLNDLNKFKKKIYCLSDLNKIISNDIKRNFFVKQKKFIIKSSKNSNLYFSDINYNFAKKVILL